MLNIRKKINSKEKMINPIEREQIIPESWDDSDLKGFKDGFRPKKKMGFALRLFIWSFLAFIIAISIFLFTFLNQSSSFSEKKILVSTIFPASITSGENGELNVKIINNNNTPILGAYIVADYDSGENSFGNKNVVNKKIEIGDILARSIKEEKIDFILFGSEGSTKDIKITLYYKVPKSNAEFNKDSNTINILLKTSPVTINVENLKKIHKDHDIDFTITVNNNTSNEIKDLIVSARNPNNFTYKSSSETLYKNTPSWKIDSLSANSKKIIKMTGKVSGDVGYSPVFTFFVGIKNSDASSTPSNSADYDSYNLEMDNIYSKVEKKISITDQYLDINITNDISSPSYTVSAGQILNLEFTYNNNLSESIDNASFIANLSGDALDMDGIQVQDGFVDKQNKAIIWNASSMRNLSKISANSSGKLRLVLRIKRDALVGENINLIMTAAADRTSESEVSNNQDISFNRVWTVSE